MAGAVFYSIAAGQQPPRDTLAVPRDTTPPAADTVRTRPDTVVKRDTVKAPLVHAEFPAVVEVAGRYHWTRDELFVGGGLTLLELLERIPGATAFPAGWFASPSHVTWLGGGGRIRVFYDGVELEPFDERTGGVLDLAEIQLWTLEEVLVERGANELRVYLRSWRVNRTTTASRTDVFTGDQDANLYRGFLGRRFSHGEALQAGFQQYGTTGIPSGGGDELALFARLGWAARGVSIDAFGIRARRQRNLHQRDDGYQIPRLNSIRRDAYARIGLGDPDSGAWAQVMLATQAFTRERNDDVNIPLDSIEGKFSRNQLVGAAGWSADPFRVSLTSRSYGGEDGFQSLTGRASLDHPLGAIGVMAEWRGGDSSSVAEIGARFSPFSFLSMAGVAGIRRPPNGIEGDDILSARGELGIRLGDLWFTGGAVLLDSMQVTPPIIFDTALIASDEGRTMGLFGGIRGRVWRAIHVDVAALRWDRQGFYRPQMQVSSAVFVRTRWLRKFPSGHFGALISVRHNYRDGVSFRTNEGPLIARGSHELNSLIEIRIVDAVIFWRQRYTIGQLPLEFVPGYFLPRQTTLYGVRWDFWN
ncbi:MAG: hypothetical protein M3125_09030 [Gemmatimonadota bacterium]|nr:hypothetical protein [Gemmatimonadota bacterium]